MRFKTKFYALFLVLSVIGGGALFAQDTLRLSLDDALNLALSQSPAIQTARLDSLAAEGRWRVITGGQLPQVKMTQDLPSWREYSQEQFVYDPDRDDFFLANVRSGDLRWSSALDVTQDLPWGASLELSSEIYRREWYREGNDDNLEFSLLNRVLLNQPLLAGNPVGRDRRIGRINYDEALLNYELQRREVIYNVTRAFFEVVSAEEALRIAEKDLELGRSSEILAQRKLNAGLIPEVELLQIQVDLARREGSYRQSAAAAESAREGLKTALGLPFSQPTKVDFEIDLADEIAVPALRLEGERLEMRRERLDVEKLNLQTRASLLAARVRASLQTYYEIDTYRERFDDLDKPGDRNLGVILHLEVPIIGFGTVSGRVQELKAQRRRAEIDLKVSLDRYAADLREALRSLDLALDRIRIASAALTLSEKSSRITEERFENGLINSRDLLDSQLELTRTRREALDARIDYELALANLKRITPLSQRTN